MSKTCNLPSGAIFNYNQVIFLAEMVFKMETEIHHSLAVRNLNILGIMTMGEFDWTTNKHHSNGPIKFIFIANMIRINNKHARRGRYIAPFGG